MEPLDHRGSAWEAFCLCTRMARGKEGSERNSISRFQVQSRELDEIPRGLNVAQKTGVKLSMLGAFSERPEKTGGRAAIRAAGDATGCC